MSSHTDGLADPALLAALRDSAAHAQIVPSGPKAEEALLSALLRVASGTAGLVVSVVGSPFAMTSVRYVSPRVLALLSYQSVEAYAEALAADALIHPQDLAVVTSHTDHHSTAIYDARMRRGGGGYRDMRIQGLSIRVRDVVYRLTLIAPR